MCFCLKGEFFTCNQETGHLVEANEAAGMPDKQQQQRQSVAGTLFFFSSVQCWRKQMKMQALDQRAEETAGLASRCHQTSLLFGSGRRFNFKSCARRLHFQSRQLFSETSGSCWAIIALLLVPAWIDCPFSTTPPKCLCTTCHNFCCASLQMPPKSEKQLFTVAKSF